MEFILFILTYFLLTVNVIGYGYFFATNISSYNKNTNIGYSYSHISNNDWGSVNPGVDNQSITFSKNF